ncbi:hypothetical protein P9112_002320 [Eukaryota sp. TZLM1-RC]
MDNALQTTTVGASVNKIFGSDVREAMERQFQVLASIRAHADHIARLFVFQHPEHSMWLKLLSALLALAPTEGNHVSRRW